jgi:hypothetical protein
VCALRARALTKLLVRLNIILARSCSLQDALGIEQLREGWHMRSFDDMKSGGQTC